MNLDHTHPTTRLALLQQHWPEYLMEAAELGTFMVSACVFAVLMEHPASPIRQALPDALARRAVSGLIMGLTAVGLIYSPWGRRSGAHMNPVLTFTFWRLGKIDTWDAVFYALAQCCGGAAGVLLSKALLRAALAHPAINYAVTVPGPSGAAVAWLAEMLISLALMLSVLIFSNHPALARWTGLFAGLLIILFVTFEAPLSGTSMNPARTLGSALFAGQWTAFWVYLTAPPAGMLTAAALYTRAPGVRGVLCAKLCHSADHRCIFCAYQHRHDAINMPPASAVGMALPPAEAARG